MRSLRMLLSATAVLALLAPPFARAAEREASATTSSIRPRKPTVPPAADSGLTNPIDRLLQPYFASRRFVVPAVVDDRVFARRAHLDLVGLLPTPNELEAFLADRRPEKRELLVQRLLADKQRYAEHWLTFWNDALRNDYRGTGYIDGGRKQITPWLYAALANNMPYDQFVRELISPTPESEGFVKGIVWRGVVNASQVPPVQAAQNISQVFMGINLKCASCHDSFINDWKLSDAYGLAGLFADGPLEIHRCDQPTGQFAPLQFLYPELGRIDPQAPRVERLKQLAAVVTSRENGRLTRTIVNRLWARLLGRGLVEPVDEMDNLPWDRDLLDWLAADLADHDYNLQHTLTLMVTSRAYQLPAVGLREERPKEFAFRGPVVRRMSAEQYLDALAAVSGPWPAAAAVQLTAPTAEAAGTPGRLAGHWIWKDKNAARATDGGRIFLRKTFELDTLPDRAAMVATCDNQFTLFVNGKQVASSDEWQKPRGVDVRPHLIKGLNAIAAEAINWPDPETKSGLQFSSPNGAGFFFSLELQFASKAAERSAPSLQTVGSDASWLWSQKKLSGWEQTDFKTEGWQHAFEVADANGQPWNLAKGLQTALQQPTASRAAVRVALTNADPLQTALGRTNREQVITDRPQAATTLQALELTNGATLASQIERGAKRWLAEPTASGPQLIDGIYLKALGRQPTAGERTTATELLGSPVTREGVEDLLWVLFMLPEFQLIY